jgi:DNA-binding PadR family transcriptional regulator
LLIGEWACLGILAQQPAHGFAVARRLQPAGDVGRVWSLSRPLTYRAVDNLLAGGLIEALGEEPGIAGGSRTIYAPTAQGRIELRRWLGEPVGHLRDVRSELLLKVVLCDVAGVDVSPLVNAQRAAFIPVARRLAAEARQASGDPVTQWRYESSRAVLRFLDRLAPSGMTPGADD